MTNPVVDTNAAPYKESDDHVADPTAVFGTLETSGTAGGDNERAEKISPIFDAAKAQDLAYAARAVDPDDTEVDEGSAVVLSTGVTQVAGDPNADRERVRRAAAAFQKEPVAVEDPSVTDAEKENAQKKDEAPAETATRVEAQQSAASPAGGAKTTSDDAAQRRQAGTSK